MHPVWAPDWLDWFLELYAEEVREDGYQYAARVCEAYLKARGLPLFDLIVEEVGMPEDECLDYGDA